MSTAKTGKTQKGASLKAAERRPSRSCQQKQERAVMLHNQGQLAEAEKIYRAILAQEPDNPDALHLLGVIALHNQNFDTALEYVNRAIAINPKAPSFRVNLGKIYEHTGEFTQALAAYQQASELQPSHTDAWFFAGNLQKNLGRTGEAITSYQQVLKLNPNHAATLNNLGNIYRDSGRFTEAIACYLKGQQADPSIAELHVNMGNAYKDMNKAGEAVACYEKAIQVRPDSPEPYNNIGYILQRQGKLSAAIPYLQKALELQPDLGEVHHNLGNGFKDMGEFDKAISHYRKALALKPHFPSAHGNILFAINYAENADQAMMYAAALNWWEQQAAHLVNQFAHHNSPEPGRKIRIGYISPDFCLHSVSFFFLPLLQAHDTSNFETFCYSDVKTPDEMTAKLQRLAAHWRPIAGMSDEAVARQVNNDGIDILVDLAGHTADNRLLAFARKPAPVQVSWLGYPNTTGVRTIVYRITDSIADPEGSSDALYTEKLVRLANCFLCYSPPDTAPPVSALPASTNHRITFGSFNNITKTTKQVVETWSEILRQAPDSRLVLKSTIFADPPCRERYLGMFAGHGIQPERVDLRERTASTEDHLMLYNEIDIALDPFPYNGTTTTCEALWMGVPVIALRGNRHCARVSSSILTHCQLPHLIAESHKEYVAKAVALAQDLGVLAKFRQNARSLMQRSTLCNPEIFARDMERALRTMWTAWCRQDTTPPTKTGQRKQMTSKNMSSAKKSDEETGTALMLNRKGEELFNAGNAQEAAQLFEQAIGLDPGCAIAYNNLGVLSFHGGQLDKALQCFKKALEINPEDRAALDNIGDILQFMQTPAAQQGTSREPSPDTASAAPIQDREEILKEIKKFPFWYHKIKLPGGIVTPGWAPINPAAYRIPDDLTGKRVLDVGAWDGYWTFEALRRGAREVIAIDDFSDYLGQLQESDRKAWATFDFCKKQLGYDDLRCKRFDMSIYDLSEKTFGHFDIVFFFGTFYHLRHPLLALDKLAAVCDQEIFIETAILDDYSPYRGGLGQGYPGNQMVMEFYPGMEYGNNDSNWWAPTLYCLINMMHAAGFKNCRGWKLMDAPPELSHCRGFASGSKDLSL
jgi:protein O-GlcNAc transferase